MKKGKILIIEDDIFVRDLYEKSFKSAGYRVSVATDGTEGLTKAVSERPDLILLDIMLPRMSGLDVLKELRKRETTKDVPVLLLTNLSHESVIKEGFSLGAQGYLVKVDYTPHQIVEEINRFISELSEKTAS